MKGLKVEVNTITKNIKKIGHFYFGKNRTFLNWLDI